MLTLKSPLPLQSSRPILTISDRLSHKIMGNYQCMHLSMTAQDLLYMTMQEPDFYITSLQNQMSVFSYQEKNQNTEKLEIMNQFLNRIMLLHTSEFTYQDEVFVSTILQKLGIIEVDSFISQIRNTMDQNTLLQLLVTKYFEQGEEMEQALTLFLEEHKDVSLQQKEIEEQVFTSKLQEVVFTHLSTAEHINTVYDYQKNIGEQHKISKELAKLLPQLLQADVIHLGRWKQHIFQQSQPMQYIQQNQYEAKQIETEEITQQQLMQYMAAAILSNIVPQVMYDISTMSKNQLQWIDFTQTFYGSAEDTIQRLKETQIEKQGNSLELYVYQDYRKQLLEDELQLLEIISQVNQTEITLQDSTEEIMLRQHTILALLENHNLQQQIEENMRVYISKIQNAYNMQSEESQNQTLQSLQQQAYFYRQMQEYEQKQINQLWRTENANQSVNVLIDHSREQIDSTRIDRNYINREEHSVAENAYTQEIKQGNVENTEITQDDIISYLYRINEKNVTMQQILSKQHITNQNRKKVVVNKKLAKEKACKILENPQEVLQEIYQSSFGIEAAVPEEIEKILSYTDEKTRRLYENMLGIATKRPHMEPSQVNREDTIIIQRDEKEIIVENNTKSDFVQRKQETVNTYEKIEKMTKLLQDIVNHQKTLQLSKEQFFTEERAAGALLSTEMKKENKETFSFLKLPLQKLEQQVWTEKQQKEETVQEKIVTLIHQRKEQIQEEMVDEILKKVSGKTEIISNETTVEQTITKHVQETKKEILSESEEMVEEILHKNLQTQMHVISDQVYQDIERRLQSERRRRGY